MRVFGIIGYPLGHSFSQKYFTEKFQREGIDDCKYEVYPVMSIYEMKDIIKQNPNLIGLNITIPYKQLVLRHLYTRQNIPSGVRACNCVKVIDGQTWGYNTDVIGFEQSLLPLLDTHHSNALILGNGGAAEAVKYVLQKFHINCEIVSRKIHDGSKMTYADLNETIIKNNLLIINTTPLGTFPKTDECPDIPYQHLTSQHFLYDLVYNPEKTLFLKKGEERGTVIKNGYEMLVMQAEESWSIWNM